jgi:hypothetical protein
MNEILMSHLDVCYGKGGILMLQNFYINNYFLSSTTLQNQRFWGKSKWLFNFTLEGDFYFRAAVVISRNNNRFLFFLSAVTKGVEPDGNATLSTGRDQPRACRG